MMGLTWGHHGKNGIIMGLSRLLDYHGVIMVMKKNEPYPLVNEQFANSKITTKLYI